MCAGNGETEAVAQGKGRRRPMFHVKHLCVITRAPACIFFERHTQQTESSLRFFRHAPSTSAGISRKSKSPRICFHRCGGWVIRYRGSLCGALVLDDLRDGAHGAFLDAVAARNAGILVHNVSLAANNLEHFLRAGVDADATANALIGIDNRVRHVILLLVQNTREHTGNFPKNLLPARYHCSMQMQEKSAIFQGAVRILSWMLGVRASSVKAARLRVCGQRQGGARKRRNFSPRMRRPHANGLSARKRPSAYRRTASAEPRSARPTSADARQLLAHEHVEDARAAERRA